MIKIKLLLAMLILISLTNCSAQNYKKFLLDDKVHVRNKIYPKGHAGNYSSSTVSKNNLHSSFKVDSLYRLKSFSLRDSLIQIRGTIEYKKTDRYIMYLSIIDNEKSQGYKTWSVSCDNKKVLKGLEKGGQFLGKWTQYNEDTKEEEGSIVFVDKMGKEITEIKDKFGISSYIKSKEGKTNLIENFLKYGDILGG